MGSTHFCGHCGDRLESGTQFCQKCGAKIPLSDAIENAVNSSGTKCTKSGKVAFFLCIFFGIFGVHRFYVGKIGTGILSLITGGGLGIWTLIDLILIAKNKFYDKNGQPLRLTNNISPLNRILLIIASVVTWIIISIALFFALIVYFTSHLVDTVNKQLSAIHNGDYKEAYSYTSSVFQKATSLDNFQKMVSQFPALVNTEHAVYDQRGIDLNSGFLIGTLTAKDGTQTRIEFQFIKEAGAWKIMAIKIITNNQN